MQTPWSKWTNIQRRLPIPRKTHRRRRHVRETSNLRMGDKHKISYPGTPKEEIQPLASRYRPMYEYKKKISLEKLESVIRRLNLAATACPITRYYLNRLQHTLEKWKKEPLSKSKECFLPKSSISDLKLWREYFLPKIHKGISLNIITYWRPTIICWSDTCPKGLGGYNHGGLAWRWEISPKYQQRVQNKNNTLEFLALLFTVWFTISKKIQHQYPCFFALGDNSSAIGWLHKANIDAENNFPLHEAARKFAEILIQHDCCLYSQHIQGVHNNVTDALSRGHNNSPEELHNYISCDNP